MNLTELEYALRKLRLSGMADVLEMRLVHAQADRLLPLDFIAMLVSDELQRRQDRLLEPSASRPASAIRRAHSTPSISPSTRK